MKHLLAAMLSLLTIWATPAIAGQSAEQTTPTTRILAVGTLNPGIDMAAARAILPEEVKQTVQLYLDGKIDQWYSLEDRAGVVFILNVTDLEAANAMLERLPLGQAHYMSFKLTPLGPLGPLRQLQGMQGMNAPAVQK